MMSSTRTSLYMRRAAAVVTPQCRGLAVASSSSSACLLRRFASVARPPVSPAERAALRAARKERASKVLEQQQQQQKQPQPSTMSSSTTTTTSVGSASPGARTVLSRYIWYLSVGVPSILLAWGFSDENSPPAKFCRAVGLTGYIRSYTDEIAKPAHTKLLPDWAHVRLACSLCVLAC